MDVSDKTREELLEIIMQLDKLVNEELELRDTRELEMLRRLYGYMAPELDAYKGSAQQEG